MLYLDYFLSFVVGSLIVVGSVFGLYFAFCILRGWIPYDGPLFPPDDDSEGRKK